MKKQDRELLDTIFLQPWFLPRDTAFAIKRILPPEHRHRMKFYYDDYGCLKCGEKDEPYGSNALCKACMQEVKLKLFFAIKRRWTAASPDNLPRTFKRMADAQRLLKDLLDRQPKAPLKGEGERRSGKGSRRSGTDAAPWSTPRASKPRWHASCNRSFRIP